MHRGTPAFRAAKRRWAALGVVQEILFGTTKTFRFMSPDDAGAAQMMADVYATLNDILWT